MSLCTFVGYYRLKLNPILELDSIKEGYTRQNIVALFVQDSFRVRFKRLINQTTIDCLTTIKYYNNDFNDERLILS